MKTTSALTILVKTDEKAELFKIAAKQGLTASQYCRDLIRKALDSNGRSAKN